MNALFIVALIAIWMYLAAGISHMLQVINRDAGTFLLYYVGISAILFVIGVIL